MYNVVLSYSDVNLPTIRKVCCRNAEVLAAQQVVSVLLIYVLIYICAFYSRANKPKSTFNNACEQLIVLPDGDDESDLVA